MEYKVNGTLSKILPIESGTSKAGDEWQKVSFIVTNSDGYEGREQNYCFQIFGIEKVENFQKYNQEGATVEVKFNIRTNEWKGKYYTELQAYRVESSDYETPTKEQVAVDSVDDGSDSLPF